MSEIFVPGTARTKENKLYGQIVLILLKAGVTIPEVEECMEWCFGKGAWYVPIGEWVKRWNKKHGRIFVAKEKDKFVEFVYVCAHMFIQDKQRRALNAKSNGAKA